MIRFFPEKIVKFTIYQNSHCCFYSITKNHILFLLQLNLKNICTYLYIYCLGGND